MVSKTLTISCPEHLLDFLDENPSISASKLFQSKVEDLLETLKHNPQLIEARKDIMQLQKVKQRRQEEMQKMAEFITIKGLWKEFSNG